MADHDEGNRMAADELEGTMSVTLLKATTVTGEAHEAGDTVDVYPWQVWGLVHGGYVSADEVGRAANPTEWGEEADETTRGNSALESGGAGDVGRDDDTTDAAESSASTKSSSRKK